MSLAVKIAAAAAQKKHLEWEKWYKEVARSNNERDGFAPGEPGCHTVAEMKKHFRNGAGYAMMSADLTPEQQQRWLQKQLRDGVLRDGGSSMDTAETFPVKDNITAFEWRTNTTLVIEPRAFACSDAMLQVATGFTLEVRSAAAFRSHLLAPTQERSVVCRSLACNLLCQRPTGFFRSAR